MEWLTMSRWSPYAVGVGIGVLTWLTFLLSNKPIGVSGSFARTAGMLEGACIGRQKVQQKPYYQLMKPVIDWEWIMVGGLLVGAFLAAVLSNDFRVAWIPAKWDVEIGGNVAGRLAVALFGGICVGFGARWGGGCTSGHGISGTLQLAISSWVAAICFFLGGIAAAMLIYHVLVA